LQYDHAPPDADNPCLVPVRLVSPPASVPVEVLLPSGLALRLSPDCDLDWLRHLLPLLAGRAMLTLPPSVRIWSSTSPTDLRS
jgi:hypothetical protein